MVSEYQTKEIPPFSLSGLWGLRPPGASRCSARTSLRAPSRPHPRLMGLRQLRTCHLPNRSHLPHSEVVVDGATSWRFGVRRFGASGVPPADSTYAGGGGGKECA